MQQVAEALEQRRALSSNLLHKEHVQQAFEANRRVWPRLPPLERKCTVVPVLIRACLAISTAPAV